MKRSTTQTNPAIKLIARVLSIVLLLCTSSSLFAQSAPDSIRVFARAVCDDGAGTMALQGQYYVILDSLTSDVPGDFIISVPGNPDVTYTPGTTGAVYFGPFAHSGTGGEVQVIVAQSVDDATAVDNEEVPEVLCGIMTDNGLNASGPFCTATTNSDMNAGGVLTQSAPGSFMTGGNSGQVQVYLIVRDTFIVQSNMTGLFTNLSSDTFTVYAINYRLGEPLPNFLAPGQSIVPILNGINTTEGDSPLDGACYTVCNTDPAIVVPLNCLSIGSTVFTDLDNDALFEVGDGESGIPNVQVDLYTTSVLSGMVDSLIATTMTDAGGNYFFGGLAEGNYVVSIPMTPNGLPLSSTNSTPPVDSDLADNTDYGIQTMAADTTNSPVISLMAQMEPDNTIEIGGGNDQDDNINNLDGTMSNDEANGNMLIDFGFAPSLSLGSTVFYDVDNSGDQNTGDPLEMGIANVVVILYQDTSAAMDGSGFVVIDSTLTNMDGNYLFDTLAAGNYQVAVLTTADAPLPSTGPATSAPGQDDTDVDGNNNGVVYSMVGPMVAAGDTLRSGTIVLSGGGEPVGNAESSQGGNQDDADATTDANGNMTVDFGFVPVNSLGSNVFFDMDNDGMQDNNTQEAGIPGITLVLLFDANNDGIPETPVDTIMTDADGNYFFGNLPDGVYAVNIPMAPADANLSSTPNEGGDLQNDNLQNGTQAVAGGPVTSGPITLTGGSEPLDLAEPNAGGNQDADFDANGDQTIDFGFVPMLSIGSSVFYDQNNNGTQDLGNPLEYGIAGVEVVLFQDTSALADGSGLVAIDTFTTDAMGNYLFDMLSPGNYVVAVPSPEDAQTSSSDIASSGSDNQVDLDDNGVQAMEGDTAYSPVIMLMAGTEPVEPTGNPGADQDDTNDMNGDMTVDFGFVPDLSIGSTVFYDPNNDGLQNLTDPLESGIAGVIVQLYADLNGDGTAETLVGTDTTDAQGNYFFDMLPMGDYQVVIPTPDNSAPTSSTGSEDVAGNATDVDLDDNGQQLMSGDRVTSNVFTLTANNQPIEDAGNPGAAQDTLGMGDADGNMTVDFGFVPNLSIGSTVFYDQDGDGVQEISNPLEDGIDSVTLVLALVLEDVNGMDSLVIVATTMTDSLGNYLFDSLPEGNYQVIIPITPGDAPNSSMGESGIDDDMDGNDDGIQAIAGDSVFSPTIQLMAGDEPTDETGQGGDQDQESDENGNMTIDFGFVPNMSIGSTVFYDMDNNGMQDLNDPQETGIANVTVQLLTDINNDGVIDQSEVIETVLTDNLGNYLFDSLPSGAYQVLIPTTPNGAPNSSTDIATSGMDNQTDLDDNGQQATPGGSVISPVVVLSPMNEPIETAGNPGAFQDTTGGLDSNGDMTIDFGFVPMLSVGSTVFYDQDNDGMQDADNPLEGGIENVAVVLVQVLMDGAGMDSLVVLDTTFTDVDGNYLFDSLSPGDYQIMVAAPVDAQMNSDGSTPADDDIDGVDDGEQAMAGDTTTTATFTLSVGGEPTGDDESFQGGMQDEANDGSGNMTIDVSFVPDLSIGSTVFYDMNNDGMQDGMSPLETGIANVIVQLLADTDGDGIPETIVGTDTTDANGNYFFGNLPEGTYAVNIPMGPPGTDGSSTPVDTGDLDDDLQNGTENVDGSFTSTPFELTAGDEPENEPNSGGNQDVDNGFEDADGNMTIDFGFIPSMSIGSTVFGDNNANGELDGNEMGIDSVLVLLSIDTSGNGDFVIVDSVYTDEDGNYLFDSIVPGDYVVSIVPPADNPLSSPGENGLDDNMDDNDDGIQEFPGDTISSPTITLTPGDEPEDEDGQAGNQDAANDDDGNMTIDFGLVPVGSIGSQVFADLDNNGLYDMGSDLPLDGVIVELYADNNMDGIPDGPAIATDTTDVNGLYFFGMLAPGSYIVGVPTAPTDYQLSSTPTDNTENTDGNDDGIQIMSGDATFSSTITLTAGMEPGNGVETFPGGMQDDDQSGGMATVDVDTYGDMTVDFGFTPAVSVGSTVWLDNNNDGILNVGEPGIPGVQVVLFDVSGMAVDTAITDEDGNYFFGGLPQGEYYIQIPADQLMAGGLFPMDATSSTPDNDADNDTDGNDDGMQDGGPGTLITSETFTLTADLEPTDGVENGPGATQDSGDDNNGNMTVDFGLFVSMFDLALLKELAPGQEANVEAGDTVAFIIRVFNQGNLAADNIRVSDYLPNQEDGFLFDPTLNPGWNVYADIDDVLYIDTLLTTFNGLDSLAMDSFVTIPVFLVVNPAMEAVMPLTNLAEISGATGPNGEEVMDIDSPMDTIPGNDPFFEDNEINGDGLSGGDEDNSDPATIFVGGFDLALTKTLAEGQPNIVSPGDNVTFEINITNQGAIPADNIGIIDYIPQGFIFDPALNLAWTAIGDSSAVDTISVAEGTLPVGGLLPTQSTTVQIVLTVAPPTFPDYMPGVMVDSNGVEPGQVLINTAEITTATDDEGEMQTDIDSSPDGENDDNDDGNEVDGEVNGGGDLDGDGINDEDEDDSDIAVVTVECYQDAGVSNTIQVCLGCDEAEVVINLFESLSGRPNIGGIFAEGELRFLDDEGNFVDLLDVNGNTFGDAGFNPDSVVISGELDRALDYSITYTIPAINDCPELTATITIDVIDIQNLSCTGFTNISLGEDCEATITPDLILQGDLFCASSLTVELIDGSGNSIGNVVGAAQIGQTFFVNLTDEQCNNTCWGQILVEDKRRPTIDCAPDTNGVGGKDFICIDIDQILTIQPVTYSAGGTIPAVLNITGVPVVADNCATQDELTVSFRDLLLPAANPACDDRVILRTFTVSDPSGNTAICVQEITVRAPTLNDVMLPADSIFQVECNTDFPMLPNGNPTPASVGGPSVMTALGTYDIEGNGSFCNLAASFVDGPRITTCTNTFKFVRTWTVFDWCNVGDPALTYVQVVKVGDFTAPTFTIPTQDLDFDGVPDVGPLFYSTNTTDCESIFQIPGINAQDNCSPTVNVAAFIYLNGDVTAAPLGAFAEGDFVNPGLPVGIHTLLYVATDLCGNADTLELQIEIADQTAPVAICEDGLNISIATNGTAQLCATDINRASYDDCSEIELTIVRVGLDDQPLPGETYQECITLTCADLGTVRVSLRVRDDADVDGDFDADDNVNYCWLDVLVEDKLAPICVAPAPATFDCTDLDNDFPQDLDAAFLLDPVGTAALLDGVFGAPTGIDNCDDLMITQTVIDNRSSCGTGIIQRSFTITDGAGFVSAPGCTQVITVLSVHDYTIVFPGDQENDDCVQPDYNGVSFTEFGCDLITVSTSIDTFTATADECYKLRITYEVLNWCEYNSLDDAYMIPRDADGDGVLDMDTTVLHVIPNGNGNADDLAYLDRDVNRNNFNTIGNLDTGDGGVVTGTDPAGYGQDGSRGAFRYQQFIKVYDNTPPALVVVAPDSAFCSLSNDCTADVEIGFSIGDECSPASVNATVDLDQFIDAGADGIFTLAEFVADQPVSNLVTNNGDGTYTINLANIAIGRHALRISATDGCGNTAIDLLIFEVEDCKAPTPICINGLTVTLMPDGDGGGMASIWASDFIASDVTDCSGPVKYAIYLDGEQPMSPNPADTGLLLDCSHFGFQLIRVYAIDANGQADYCLTTLDVQVFNGDICDNSGASLAGLITTEFMVPISDVEVALAGSNGASSVMTTSTNGTFLFAGLEAGEDYTVTPTHFTDYMNGVTTGDIVALTRHILGIQEFDSPFQYIAGDVDGSEVVNVVDIIAIRRLILGLADNYPNGQPSWRFVSADYDFPQANNPWAETFPEVNNYNNLLQNITDSDFIGAKLGDVNNSVVANSFQAPEARELRGDLFLEMDEEQLQGGESYNIPVRAAELSGVAGYQFTLEFDQLAADVVRIDAGLVQDGNFGWRFASQGLITASWNWENGLAPSNWSGEEVLFTLVVNARENVALSEVLSISSRYTMAEAYGTDGRLRNVGLIFELPEVITTGYSLHQNSPNPFERETVIGYELPTAAPVTITVTDVRGRLIRTFEKEGTAGYNNLRVTRRQIGAAGVYYYTVSSDEWTATRKMILLR